MLKACLVAGSAGCNTSDAVKERNKADSRPVLQVYGDKAKESDYRRQNDLMQHQIELINQLVKLILDSRDSVGSLGGVKLTHKSLCQVSDSVQIEPNRSIWVIDCQS